MLSGLKTWLMAGALVAALSAAWAGGPSLAVPQAAAPILDGEIGEVEWAPANSPCLFVDIANGNLATAQPVVRLMADETYLYVGASLPLPGGKKPVTTATGHDGPVWEDDALEIFLDPEGDGTYFQFIVNSAGAQWDSQGQDGKWDAPWDCVAKVGKGAWNVEVAIPLAAVTPHAVKPGDSWRANFAWDRKTPSPLIASWAHIKNTLHQASAFAELRFGETAPALQFESLRMPPESKVQVEGVWCAPVPTEIRLTVLQEQEGKLVPVAEGKGLHAGGACADLTLSAPVPVDGRFVAAGKYMVSLVALQSGKEVYVAQAPVEAPRPLVVTTKGYFLRGTLTVNADISGTGEFSPEATVTAKVTRPDGKLVFNRPLTPIDGGPKYATELDMSALPTGAYSMEVVAVGRKGNVLHRETVTFEKPEKPGWLGSQAGISEDVLAPWTPVAQSGSTVSVWGRDYQFGALPFPEAVQTRGESILAAPIMLRLVADGQEFVWKPGADPQTADAKPNRVTLNTSALADRVQCEGTVAVEYDGMIRSDFSVTPRGIRNIERLSLVIPIKAEHAKYLYHFPGRWGSAYNAGALPAEGFTSGFRPYIWLGDEDLGFAWFSESDEGFLVDEPNRVVQIKRTGDVVTLEVAMIDGKRPAAGKLNYTFGFQATPVKPLTPDTWDYRICHHGGYGIEDQPWHNAATITYPATGNIDLKQGTFEAWVKPAFDTDPEEVPEDASRGRFNRDLFTLNLANGDRVGFYWNIDDRGMRVYYRQGTGHPLVAGVRCPWQADEWHHVAFTWGDKTCIYIDGEKRYETSYKGTITGSLVDAEIVLGMPPSEFAIDDVRISDIPRTRFDLSQSAVDDEHTLLLDRLDRVDPNLSKRPTGAEKGADGLAVGGKVVNGKWGYGFELYEQVASMTLLDRLEELGVKTICFHEHWTDIQAHTTTTYGERLHKLVKACHERGIQILLYFGYEISDIAPEWNLYGEECIVGPRQGGYTRQPPQTAYNVCYRSAWQDFLADGIARIMDEYDIDGVYLDGTEFPWGCENTLHGCGYKKPDGTIGKTYTFFDTRDMMQRIYTIVKSRKPGGQVNVHNSTCMTTPTLAWATSTWDGEQFGSMPRGPDPLEVLPLDAFRCEFMGRQWGVPAEFLCYNRPYTYNQAMAFTLLHDVLVRGSLGGSLELEAKLWEGMEKFGRSSATWLPYWEDNFARTGPDASIKASVYSRAEAGAAIVVSNLGAESKQAELKLDLEGLAISPGIVATDMLTGKAIEVTADGAMSFPLDSFGFRVIVVAPQ